jgi:hypothetical protein
VILEVTKRQQEHRIEMEKIVIKASVQGVKRGHWFGFIIGLTVVIR